ncbi:MAG: hypothetical protein GY711_35380 [bacterium]|nr:hypothetical protein [bacterium]
MQTASATVDVLDTRTGTWTETQLPTARYLPASAVLDGRAYFAGGSTGAGGPSTAVDIFEPATGSWTQTALSRPRLALAGAAVGSRVLFAGGAYTDWPYLETSNRVDIYDTATGQWSTAVLSKPRMYLSAVAVGDKVLFAGGVSWPVVTDRVDIYDNATGTWSTASLSVARSGMGSAAIDGRAVFVGGNGATHPSGTVDIYDDATGAWTTDHVPARAWLSGVEVDGRLLFGGSGSADRVDIFDGASGTWSHTRFSDLRVVPGVASAGGKAFFAGGISDWPSSVLDSIEVYDLDVGTSACSPAAANSSGSPAAIRAWGHTDVLENELTLAAFGLPANELGYFLAGRMQGATTPPGSQGVLCLAGAIARFDAPAELVRGPRGRARIDLTAIPTTPPAAVLPGETWLFQCWYRDAGSSNLSDAVRVTFE